MRLNHPAPYLIPSVRWYDTQKSQGPTEREDPEVRKDVKQEILGRRTPPAFAFLLDLETALVDEVEGLYRVAAVDDARDVDLVRALADHLDVDIAFGE